MKRYEVTATRAIRGHEPGEKFEDEIPEDQERRLLARGSLKVLTAKKSKSDKGTDDDATSAKDKEPKSSPGFLGGLQGRKEGE